MYHSFLIHSSADAYLGCFHVLAIINSAVMNLGVHMSLSILVSFVCMPSNLEKEEWNWRNQPAWLRALLQSHSHQDSMVLSQRQKYRSMEQNRKPRDKSTHIWTPYLWQRRQEYTIEYYSAIKKNTFESVLMRWMKLEPIIQSEISQKKNTNTVY